MTDRSDVPPNPIQACLQQLHARFASDSSGAVATYIPELAKADPAHFGVVIATVDGQLYEVGDTRVPFTIQSISKPLVYGVALEDRGRARVQQAVGVEPSGDAFNSISLEPGTGRPLNPMINAGAIASASLVAGDSPQARFERVLGALSADLAHFGLQPLLVDKRQQRDAKPRDFVPVHVHLDGIRHVMPMWHSPCGTEHARPTDQCHVAHTAHHTTRSTREIQAAACMHAPQRSAPRSRRGRSL